MTIIPWAIFAAYAIGFLVWVLRQRRSWSDNDYYDLAQKYSDAASALTSMKAELDKLQEQLEFSEDVRYTLGMENAKLVNEIEGLKRSVERGEEVRWSLVEAVTSASEAASDAIDRISILERSLRIARHKEFKAWKKRRRWVDQEWWPVDAPASWHNAIRIRRDLACPGNMEFTKNIIREYVSEIRGLEPYPLP